MISPVRTTQSDALYLLKKQKTEILQKLEKGQAEPAIATGGTAFTETTWNKLMERVDADLETVKEEQAERFARIDMEQAGWAVLNRMKEQENGVPYSYLVKDGIIEYNGVVFTCDEQSHAICLGDMSNTDEVITIPLTEGGCLKVNRNNLFDLSKTISMFSPSDVRRILQAIAQDAKCEQLKLQLDEESDGIGDETKAVKVQEQTQTCECTQMTGADEGIAEAFVNADIDRVSPEQVTQLFKDREKKE